MAAGKSSRLTQPRANPSSRWRCGHARLGKPCAAGPDEYGKCQHNAPESLAASCRVEACGSGCSQSANCSALAQARSELGPCFPEKTSWFARQSIAVNAAIFVGGLLLLCMALPEREAVFKPGNLSRKHSQILGNELVSQRCSLCHPGSHPELKGLTQDDLCMRCHDAHMPDAALRSPHDLRRDQLVELLPTQDHLSTVSHVLSAKTACATCHIEHHGHDHDLQAITDRRCQSCHQSQFASFADGHPQFDAYPYRTERRIAFDHAAHQQLHFAKKNESFDCARCHVDSSQTGQVGSVFRSVGFEQACASCHAEPIRASTIGGWAVLQVPSLAPEDVQDPDAGLQDWPQGATFDYEGPITLPMRLLLSVDEGMDRLLAELPPSGQLQDLAASERPRVSRGIAREFRQLVLDVAAGGQAAWQTRLTDLAERRLGRALQSYEQQLVAEMSAGLPPDLFRQIQRGWFQRGGGIASTSAAAEPFQLVSGRQLDDVLLGDDLLEEDAGDDDLLLNSGPQAGELLLDDGTQEPAASSTKNLKFTKLRGADHVSQGGWYLDQTLLAVRYMPRGHADRTLAAWAEFADLVESHSEQQSGRLNRLAGEVPGACTECHLIGKETRYTPRWSNWKSVRRPEKLSLFTKFDHTPHLTLPTLNDCQYCHSFSRENKSTLRQLLDSQPTRGEVCTHLEHEFQPMQRSQCVACHRPGGANDGCTQCHNYHVGNDGFGWSHQE